MRASSTPPAPALPFDLGGRRRSRWRIRPSRRPLIRRRCALPPLMRRRAATDSGRSS